MKLILHAGVHRTGSTSIQKFLAQNRSHLSEQGFLYPGNKENHQETAWALLRGKLRPEQFASAISASDAATVIASAEDLCRIAKPATLARLTSGIDLHAIFFVRRQDEWLESWYNQNIKWPFHAVHSAMSPLEFLGTLPEYPWLHYDKVYELWKPYCHKLDMVLFDEIEDSVDSFCACAGIDQNPMVRPPGRANTSLGPISLEIVRQLGMNDLSAATRSMVLRTARALESKHPDSEATVFPTSVKHMIMRTFARSNRTLAAILGRNVNAPLFPPAADIQLPPVDLPESHALLRDFVGPLLRGLDRSARLKNKAP